MLKEPLTIDPRNSDAALANALKEARGAMLPYLPVGRILDCYSKAPGGEIAGGKFARPRSSAALAANAFGLFLNAPERLSLPGDWRLGGRVEVVELEREMRFPWRGGKHPWLDVVVHTPTEIIAIESKRYEPFYATPTVTFSGAFKRDVWKGMQSFQQMKNALGNGLCYSSLAACQLVKHALGLRTQSDKANKKAHLIYLYAEPQAFPGGAAISETAIERHRIELADFTAQVAGAKVEFSSLTYGGLLAHWDQHADEKVRSHTLELRKLFEVSRE